jgi:hypothetical protein
MEQRGETSRAWSCCVPTAGRNFAKTSLHEGSVKMKLPGALHTTLCSVFLFQACANSYSDQFVTFRAFVVALDPLP